MHAGTVYIVPVLSGSGEDSSSFFSHGVIFMPCLLLLVDKAILPLLSGRRTRHYGLLLFDVKLLLAVMKEKAYSRPGKDGQGFWYSFLYSLESCNMEAKGADTQYPSALCKGAIIAVNIL